MQEKLLSVLKGAGIAAAGAVLAYVSQWASGQDFGPYMPMVVAALSVLANAVRKLAEKSAVPPVKPFKYEN